MGTGSVHNQKIHTLSLWDKKGSVCRGFPIFFSACRRRFLVHSITNIEILCFRLISGCVDPHSTRFHRESRPCAAVLHPLMNRVSERRWCDLPKIREWEHGWGSDSQAWSQSKAYETHRQRLSLALPPRVVRRLFRPLLFPQSPADAGLSESGMCAVPFVSCGATSTHDHDWGAGVGSSPTVHGEEAS